MAKTLALNTADFFPALQKCPDSIAHDFEKFPELIDPDLDLHIHTMANVDAPLPSPLPLRAVENLKQSPNRHPSPQPTHFSYKNGNGNGHRVLRSATLGYIAPEFKGKQQQQEKGKRFHHASRRTEKAGLAGQRPALLCSPRLGASRARWTYPSPYPNPMRGPLTDISVVKEQILKAAWIPEAIVDDQIEWFYNELGIDDVYFQLESVDAIVSHITSLYAAKVGAFARADKKEEIRLDMEASDHAIYIDTSEAGVTNMRGPRYEHRLEEKYLDATATNATYRVETFRSPGNLSGTGSSKTTLRCYFVYQCQFVDSNPSPTETRLELISDRQFLAKATQNTKQIYQEIIEIAVTRTGPVIEVFDIAGSQEKRLVVAFRRRTAAGMFSALSDLYHYYGVTSSRKYVEQFSNGITVICLYLKPATNLDKIFPALDASIHQITKEISLLYCIPQNKFQPLFASGRLSLQETIYAHCLWVFVQHFLNRLGKKRCLNFAISSLMGFRI
jgi:glutamate dehydrogenase